MNERVPTGCGSCRVCNRRAPVVSAASRIPSELLGVPGAGGAVPNGQIKITEGLCPARRRRESSFHSTAEEGQQRKERHASPHAKEGTSMSISWAAHRTRLLLIIFAAVLAVAGVLTLTSQGASARAGGSHAFHWGGGPKPVILLAH